MRIVFAGTPAVAVPTLRALVDAGHEVLAVVTREDAPLGRRRVLTPSPVAVAADELGLPVLKANRLDDGVTDRIAELAPELGVVVAYGGLVRARLLETPEHGWINLHFSELPAWRGAAPVQRAIMAGETELGLSVFRLVAALDAGDLYATARHPLPDDVTSTEALAALAEVGAPHVVTVVAEIGAGTAVAVPQAGEPSSAPKLLLEDAHVRFDRPAAAVDAAVRGVSLEPGAFALLGDGRVKLLRVRRVAADPDLPVLDPGKLAAAAGRVLVGTADAPLEVVTVQPAGKTAMPADAWWRGLAAGAGSPVLA